MRNSDGDVIRAVCNVQTVHPPHKFVFYTTGDTTTENDSDLSVDTLSK